MCLFFQVLAAAESRHLADGGSNTASLWVSDFIARQERFSLGNCAESQPDPSVGCSWEQKLLVGVAPLLVAMLPRVRDAAGEGPAALPGSSWV